MLEKRLKSLRADCGFSQSELGQKLHVGKTTVSAWENGVSSPDLETLVRMADIFGVSPNYLLGTENVKNKSNDSYEVPVYRAVSCGNPFIADEDIIDYEDIDPRLKSQGDHFGLRLKGRSMEPRFNEGDVVIVRKQSDVDSGSIAIVRVNGDEATMKIVKKSPEGITLVATNPDVYLPTFYSNEQIESTPVEIIGKVIELRAKF
ncbi:LexA family protein [Anaerococcus cruorum]|uniref:LexA family protein n=1 Tax=Anaerococcus cruorum TaxID=3115617 RepID=A0ABW9MW94_9FIRM